MAEKDLYSKPFLRWYDVYPRHIAKPFAAKAYDKAVKRVRTLFNRGESWAQDYLYDRCRSFKNSDAGKKEKTLIPYPATWLNQGRYEDEDIEWVEPNQERTADMERVRNTSERAAAREAAKAERVEPTQPYENAPRLAPMFRQALYGQRDN